MLSVFILSATFPTIFLKIVPSSLLSIIAFNPLEGENSINVICEKESEASKWVKYIKEIIIYLQENKIIQRNIDFRHSLSNNSNS